MNAHHQLWNSQSPNQKGKIIEEFVETNNPTLINNNEYTYYRYNVQPKIDLVLTNLKNKYNCNFHAHNVSCGSDHTPIILSLTVNTI